MILLIKKKGDYYSRFKLDIWGLSFVDEKNSEKYHHKSWLLRFFVKIYSKKMERWWKNSSSYIYSIDIMDMAKSTKKWKPSWLSMRLCSLYFLTLQDHQFRNMFKKASKLSGNLGTNYCHLLECSTMTLLYRTNFLVNIFNCMSFVKSKLLFVNDMPLSFVNAAMPVGSMIRPSKYWISWMRYHLYKSLTLSSILYNTPSFLFMSFSFWMVLLMKKPVSKDLVYPMAMDIQSMSGYY